MKNSNIKIQIALYSLGYIATSLDLEKNGKGTTIDEAVGNFIWANREELGIEIELTKGVIDKIVNTPVSFIKTEDKTNILIEAKNIYDRHE